jgi:hypothetical protein
VRVQKSLKTERAREKKHHDKTAKEQILEVGDPVYLFNNTRSGKLDARWKSHYRIMERNSQKTFTIKNQLTGDVRKVHADHLRRANLEEWPMPAPRTTRPMRKAKFVVDPEGSGEDGGGDSDATIDYDYDSETDEARPVQVEPVIARVTSTRAEKIKRGRVLFDKWQERKYC